MGRAKLREVAGRVHAHIEDKRVPLFTHFLRFVAELRPLAFAMENVHHLASFAGRISPRKWQQVPRRLGYDVRCTILNSTWYGVPQMREKLFIIGIDDLRLGLLPAFLKRTHAMDLPVGYATSRSGRPDYVPVLGPGPHYVTEIPAEKERQAAITVEEALADLAVLTAP